MQRKQYTQQNNISLEKKMNHLQTRYYAYYFCYFSKGLAFCGIVNR